jgi:rare lipoprotein A
MKNKISDFAGVGIGSILFILYLVFLPMPTTKVTNQEIATTSTPTPSPTNTPVPELTREQTGMASWYGIPDGFHGKTTASGEVFNAYDYTAAHRTLPFGTNVLVKNLTNGREIIVRINDRGPFVSGRIIDLSQAAAEYLEISGVTQVKITWEGGEL